MKSIRNPQSPIGNSMVLGCSLTLACLCAFVFSLGQTATATLFVNVHDQSGAVLPGVTIDAQQESTGIRRTGKSGASGTLVMPLLAGGRYTVSASLPGFKQEVITGIVLEVSVKATLDLVLVPGTPDERIVVSADIATLQPGNSTIGEVFDNRTLLTMPLSGREFLQLSLLAPGSAPPAFGSRLSTQANSGVHFSGAREASNNFLLDGVDNNDLFLNRFVFSPSLDSIEEFTVLANNYDAEYGRSGGGQVNVAVKSGARQTHGSIYEFFRHSGLDARNFFDPPEQPVPLLRQNQFGGTLGGSFGATQNFYFVSLEGTKGQRAETRTSNVPTEVQKQGDFRASGIVIRDPFTGQPFAENRIPGNRVDPAGVAIARLYPRANRQVAGQNFVSSPAGTVRAPQFTARFDHRSWEENPLFFRYSFVDDWRVFPFAGKGPNLPGYGISVLDRGQNFVLGASQTISARALNDFRFGFNRLRREVFQQNVGVDGFKSLGIGGPALEARDMGFPSVVLAGYETLGDDPNLPVVRRTGTFHVSDSLVLQRGRHYLKIGGENRNYQSNGYNDLFARGQIIFQGVFTGNALADLLLGLPTVSILASNDNAQALRTRSHNFFVQDDWKVGRSWTLNLGARYEYNAAPVDAHDRMIVFDLAKGQLRRVGQAGISRSGLASDFNNVAPRIGLSWDLTGQGRIVLRSGYGIFYDRGTLIENSALYFNPPYFRLNLFFTGAKLLKLQEPFPVDRAFSPRPTAITLEPDFRTAYVQQWSLALEGKIANEIAVAARYVGTKGTKLVMKRNINQPAPGPGPLDPRRPIAGFSDILFVESAAASAYHSLQLRVEKKQTGRVSFLGAYTLSKSIDNTSSFLESHGDDNTPQNSLNVGAERGLSNFDLRQRLSVAATLDLPGASRSRFLSRWQLSSILAIQSGRPFTPRLSFDNSNTGNVGGFFAHDRPNRLGDAKLSNPGPDRFFNTAAFAIAEKFSFGNAGRNILFSPGFASLDAALSKSFPVSGESRLQLRVEVYNALNRPNFQLPDSFIDRPTFGRILAAFPARQIQLALRFSF